MKWLLAAVGLLLAGSQLLVDWHVHPTPIGGSPQQQAVLVLGATLFVYQAHELKMHLHLLRLLFVFARLILMPFGWTLTPTYWGRDRRILPAERRKEIRGGRRWQDRLHLAMSRL